MNNNQYIDFRAQILKELAEIFRQAATENYVTKHSDPQAIIGALETVTYEHLYTVLKQQDISKAKQKTVRIIKSEPKFRE